MANRLSINPDYQTPVASKIQPNLKYADVSSQFSCGGLYIDAAKSSQDTQEALLIQDILYILQGHEGQLIRFANSYDPESLGCRLRGPDYQIAKVINPAFKDLTRSIISCGQWYIGIKTWAESYCKLRYGRIAQAFSEALDQHVIYPYCEKITQIESTFLHSRDYSLHSLRIDLKYMARQLFCAYNLCHTLEIQNAKRVSSMLVTQENELVIDQSIKGGELIRFLCDEARLSLGDPQLYSLFKKLLSTVSSPYIEMLDDWIHRGQLHDPFDEFLIREVSVPLRFNSAEEFDSLENKRFELRTDKCPPQLLECARKICLAGTYLKAYLSYRDPLQEELSIESENIEQFEAMSLRNVEIDDPQLLAIINKTYATANERLLGLLHKRDLIGLLSSLRHYFLFDRADFLYGFLDTANNELRRASSDISLTRLQYLLDMSLRQPGTASFEYDYKENVEVSLSTKSITGYLITVTAGQRAIDESTSSNIDNLELLTGFEAFQLDFNVPFPLSLVVPRGAIARYQFLFRRLLELKTLERDLNEIWHLQTAQDAVDLVEYREVTLRIRMTNYLYHVMYHCMTEVLEPRFQQLVREQLPACTTVDSVSEVHSTFIDRCMRECMLTDDGLLRRQGQMHAVIKSYTSLYRQSSSSKTSIDQIDRSFGIALSMLLEQINLCADASLLSLSARLHLI